MGNILGKKREHIPVQESLSVNGKLPSNLLKAFPTPECMSNVPDKERKMCEG